MTDPESLLTLFVLVVIAILLRMVPSRINGYFGSDSFYHLMVARKAREQHRLPEKDPGLVPESTRVYPPLLHAILYPFRGIGERIALVGISPLIDALTMIALFFISHEMGVKEPLWVVALYAVSPLNIVDAASLNPRPIANLGLTLAFMFSYLFWQDGESTRLVAIAVSGAVVLLANKMAVQVYIPCAIALGILAAADNPERGALLLISYLLAFVIASAVTLGGYVTKTLPDHIRFVRVHIIHGDYGQAKRSLPSPLRLAKANPISVFAPFLGLYWLLEVGPNDLVLFLVVWSMPILILAQFWIWGDSWRYLQFGTVPSALIFGYALTRKTLLAYLGGIVLLVIFVVLLLATIIQLMRVVKADPASRLMAAMRRLPSDWKEKLKGAVVYSNMAHYSVPYELGAKLFSGNPSSAGMELYFRNMARGMDSLEAVSEAAFKELGRNIDYYLLFKGFKQPRKDGFRTVFESEDLDILAQ